MKLISVVVPCYNEQEVLPLFYNEINKVIAQMQSEYDDLEFELLFINDGSKDNTLKMLRELSASDNRVRYISFSRNFGKEAGMFAGMENSKGDYVVVMDADLQHPPKFIPQMYKYVSEEGFDCATTRRVSRKGESKIRSWFAMKFYKIMNKISQTEIVDGAQDFRFMTRKMVDAVLSMKEYNRFSKGIFSWVGFNVKYIEYENVERAAGTTAWSFWKLFLYSLEGIFAFSTAPLALASLLGVLSCLIAFIWIIAIIIKTIVFGESVQGFPTIMCAIFFVGGLQLFCTGILGQYLSKTYLETKRRPIYIISETEETSTEALKKMKKIRSVSISSKKFPSGKYIKLIIVFLMSALVIMALILIKVYFDVNKKNMEKESSNNITMQNYGSYNGFEVFEDENGLLGVVNNDRVIIDAAWENVFILSENRFIVGKRIADTKKMGIIDLYGNIVSPFIFSEFRSLGNDFIGGFTGNGNEFFLFDRYGNVQYNKLWDSYEYDGSIITLGSGGDLFSGEITDKGFRFNNIDLVRKVNNVGITINFSGSEKINKVGVENILRTADIICGYLQALVNGNMENISDLTSEQYFQSLSSNNFFEGCNLNSISDFSFEIKQEKSKISYDVSILANYNYKNKNIEINGISSEIIFNMVFDENNRLILKSINKTEL